MNKMYRLLFFSFIFFLPALSIQAQNLKSFSHDSVSFEKEVLQYMDYPAKKRESKEFAKQFPEFWNSAQLTGNERRNIYKIADFLLSKKARPFPDFYNYFTSLFLFQQQNRSKQDYHNWEKGLLQQTESRKTKLSKFNDFLLQTRYLLQDSIVHQSHSSTWKAKRAHFKYVFGQHLRIVFDKADLYCIAQRDTSRIYNTSGSYDPFEKKWTGNKGKITWERAGKNPDAEYAVFDSYVLNLTKSNFTIDSVSYYNKKLFAGKQSGKLEEKINPVKNPEKALYPQFESFEKEVLIDSLFEHVSYKGGIAIHGATFIGKGSQEFPSEIQLSRNDSLFLIARSEHFTFQKNRIAGKDTEIEILIDTCKIYHPGLLFKYFPKKKELNLIRDGEGIAKIPYFNNYHKLIMDFGMLVWRLDENMMHFGSMKGANSRQARFESMNYFSMNRYMRIQGMDEQNPLVLLRKFADYMYVERFTATEYANYIKKPVNQVRQQLLGLAFRGFVSYDPVSDEVQILKRVNDYILSAMGRQDYDVVEFTTQTEDNQADAIYFIGSSDLQINGVQYIAVSDSQNVVIFPKHKKIVLKRNRDFQFDGRVMAGLIDLYGKDFYFSYEDFKIDLNSIDSLQMNTVIDSLSQYGKRYTSKVGNVLEKITGDLLIDNPNNKSGIQKFPDYPVFNSTDSCYVYYDSKDILDGVYKRDAFYFKVDPYTITNSNDFRKEDIQLTGTFVSDSIFPAFREKLSIRKDNSLGFCHVTPETGFEVYGKGTFTDTIYLSNEGLRGNGSLSYLSSLTVSKDFVFRPEEMHSNAQSFELKEQGTHMNSPEINGQQIYTQWFPYKDELYVRSTALPLDMYKKLATLAGTLKITPEGISGTGNMELVNARIESEYFTYNKKNILADTASFKLLNPEDTLSYAFETRNVNANIDFLTRSGSFQSTKTKNISHFPVNQYLCYINNFSWHMDNNLIDFGNQKEEVLAAVWEQDQMEDLEASSLNRFVSTSAKQDSLAFSAPLARYNPNGHSIQAKFVHKLRVADAFLYPDKGNVTVEKNGLLQSFRNAKLVADTLHGWHQMSDATVNVFGKKKYSGSGNYTYVDKENREQDVFFDVIDVDSLGQSIAFGNLPEEKEFYLSPHFAYKGKVSLKARDSSLFFDGQTRIRNTCEQLQDNWLDFAATVHPGNILIPVELHAIDDDNLKLYNSFFLTNDSIHIYPSFLSRRIFYTDNVLLEAKGFLTYNKQKQAYQIASHEKLQSPKATGNILSFYPNNCNLKGEGRIDPGAELGQVQQISAGTIEHDLSSNITTLDLILGIDFFFSGQAMKRMEDAFIKADLKKNKLNKTDYLQKLAEVMGFTKAEKSLQEMDANGIHKNLPKELQHSIYFNNIDFIWDKEAKAYQSVGDIGIGNINGKQLNKSIRGKVELDKKRSGNRLTMYLEIDKSTWFFFEYHHGVLFARSSDEEFNNILHETKEDKRELKDPLKKNPYSYILSPRSKKTAFVKRFNL